MTNTSVLNGDIECDHVLAAVAISSQRDSLQMRMAWLKTINSRNYSENQSKGSAAFPSLFDGGYEDFSARRAELFKQTQFNLDVLSWRQTLLTKPDAAIGAWETCVAEKIDAGHILCGAKDANQEGATLVVRWKTASGLGPLTNINADVNGGGRIDNPLPPNATLDGNTTLFSPVRKKTLKSGVSSTAPRD